VSCSFDCCRPMADHPALNPRAVPVESPIARFSAPVDSANGISRMRTISEFHYSTVFLNGATFTSDEQLHDELTLKLGLPNWYGRNFDALLDCLSSIDEPNENLCAHWELNPGKHMVLQVRNLPGTSANEALLMKFVQTISAANERLNRHKRDVKIWIEFS
jgi:hypothetical protein